ncbi:hypothetical protein PTKIN_Ptkin10aG0167800 [Pterospermum kingtungense]
MADWTQLPNDLLHHISKRLHSPLDVTRFRSVCSTWRSAATFPERHHLAPRFPCGGWTNSSGDYYFTLLKRTVFLIQTKPSTSWIVKIEYAHDPNKIQFFNPLSGFSRLYDFPEGFNLLDFRVLELGEEYVIGNSILADSNSHMGKVALSCSDSNANDFVLLSISDYRNLAMFKPGNQGWTIIHQDTLCRYYDDVIFYKGNFYAVDDKDGTLVVGLDSKTSVIGAPAYGDRKYLLESKGELFLVAMYTCSVVKKHSLVWRGKFRVFKLDEVGKEWIEVKNLGDRVLFVGRYYAFTASAKDLSVCRGNYIVFKDSIGDCGKEELEETDSRKEEANDKQNNKAGLANYKRTTSHNKVMALGRQAAYILLVEL